MQQRIADIIEKAKAGNPHSLNSNGLLLLPTSTYFDGPHVALRQEVAALRNELHAVAQVTDAVGQAVGQLYQTFLGQSEVTDQSAYYRRRTRPELTEDY